MEESMNPHQKNKVPQEINKTEQDLTDKMSYHGGENISIEEWRAVKVKRIANIAINKQKK